MRTGAGIRRTSKGDTMKTMKWTQRICIGSGLALASVFSIPMVAGAATPDPTCYTGCTPPEVSSATVTPTTVAPSDPGSTAMVNGSSSLPFTGADIGELAAIGAGAVVIGGVLARRRRSAS